MADNRKRFDMWFSFKDLKIIKHALEYYIHRDPKQFVNQEQHVKDTKAEKELWYRVKSKADNLFE